MLTREQRNVLSTVAVTAAGLSLLYQLIDGAGQEILSNVSLAIGVFAAIIGVWLMVTNARDPQ